MGGNLGKLNHVSLRNHIESDKKNTISLKCFEMSVDEFDNVNFLEMFYEVRFQSRAISTIKRAFPICFF